MMMIALLLAAAAPHGHTVCTAETNTKTVCHLAQARRSPFAPPPGSPSYEGDVLTVEQQVKVYTIAKDACKTTKSYEATHAALSLPEALLLSSLCRLYVQGKLDLLDQIEAQARAVR